MLRSIRARLLVAFFFLIMLTLALAGAAFFFLSGQHGVNMTHRPEIVIALLGGTLIALAMVLSVQLTRRMVQPISEIRQVAAQMADGNLSVRVPSNTVQEMGDLGRTINALADEVQRNIDSVTDEKNKLDAILSSMVDGVITIRRDGAVTFANAQAKRIISDYVQDQCGKGVQMENPFAVRPGTASGGSTLASINLFPVLQAVQELVASSLLSAEAVSRDMKLGDRNFNVFAIPLGVNASSRADDDVPEAPSPTLVNAPGKTKASANDEDPDAEVMLLLRDVTSLHQVEIARSQFLGNVSHELKTPLTIIKGFVVTLQKSPDITDEWKRYLDYIDRETDRLARLVDDVLNLARLRSKRTQMNFTFCEPLELLKETYRQLLPQAAKYDVTLNFDYPPSLPVLLADSDRFKEIVINLVDNAFKYSPPKTRVELQARATAEFLVVSVHDSGPGIPQEEIAYLFERYFRGSEKGGRKSGGSGIGLAIVKEIVDAHRGMIRVESEVGDGTRFIFELPLRNTGKRKAEKAP